MTKTIQVSFQSDPIFVARRLLQVYFEITLKQFDVKQLSTFDAPFAQKCPLTIVVAINNFLSTVSTDVLGQIMVQTFPNGVTLSDNDDDTYQLFKALLSTQDFKDVLVHEQEQCSFTKSYAWDKTTQLEYPVKHTGGHASTIFSIVAQHPELTTRDEQDDFVMNQLVINGYYKDNQSYGYYRHEINSQMVAPIDPVKTALSYLDLACDQVEKTKAVEYPTPCFLVSYGCYHVLKEDEYHMEIIPTWEKTMETLLKYSPHLIRYFKTSNLHPGDYVDFVNQYGWIQSMTDCYNESLIAIQNGDLPHHPDAFIDGLQIVADVDRPTTLFVEVGSPM